MQGYLSLLKIKRLPTTWCPGCGNGLVIKALIQVMESNNLNKKNTVIVSGIGCVGRTTGYLKLDSIHTLHGRAIPVAEGIKTANPKLNVFVVSGDGDLLAIGGNHLLHASRRKTNIKVICVNNRIYGMTGGQASPATPKKTVTTTTPKGNEFEEINTQAIVTSNKNFFARSTVFHLDHLKKMIKKSLENKDFSFIEVISNCYPGYGKKLGFTSNYEMLMDFKKKFENQKNKSILKKNELGFLK
ncbi:2-oxoglutarate ferredoxin oxidoreductase subunit beta [Candidatus Woesearchaeota archaeon]|nr:2-oxoglutarate ferredoxin oxidoreductase subunit beta [Candidatus Woesearchaeota archaeon]